ncbi:hypothetical protein [Actinomadura fibrosa]|uniref:Uncharacterized protein n=1 Tax=Actinomadura fibrosa TaxID=111802 RepID=A0ABW2XYI8_9ACTN
MPVPRKQTERHRSMQRIRVFALGLAVAAPALAAVPFLTHGG